MTRLLCACLVVLAAAPDGAAQKALAKERVTVTFNTLPVAPVFTGLARSLGYEVSVDANLRALVTFQAENVTAQTVLTAICESVGCRWRLDGKRLIVEAIRDEIAIVRDRPDQVGLTGSGGTSRSKVLGLDDELPFDITWSPIDLRAALSSLARLYEADVVLSPALEGRRIALTIKSASLRQALDAVCAVAGCAWTLEDTPRRTLRIAVSGAAPATGQDPAAPAAVAAAQPGVPDGRFGAWTLATRPDEFRLSARMERNPASHAAYIRGGYPAGSEGINTGSTVILTCTRDSKGKVRGTVVAGFRLPVADPEAMQAAPVRVTIDGRTRTEAWTRRWEILTLPSGFADKLAAAASVQVQVQPASASRSSPAASWITLIFPVEGFAEAWARMNQACGSLR